MSMRCHDNLGGSFWNPVARAKKAIPPAFQAKMERLINDPAVAQALAAAPPAPPPAAAPVVPAAPAAPAQ